MSGCVVGTPLLLFATISNSSLTMPQNCIYTIYTDETLEYNQSIMDAISALGTSGVPRSEWPAEVREKAGKERVNGAGEVGIEGSREEVRKEVLKGLDPSLRAFLEYVSPSSVVPLFGVVKTLHNQREKEAVKLTVALFR
jgi:hypothetical protein